MWSEGGGLLQSGPYHKHSPTAMELFGATTTSSSSTGRMDLFDQSHKESNATIDFNRHLKNFFRLCWVTLPTNPESSLFYLEALGDEVKKEMPRLKHCWKTKNESNWTQTRTYVQAFIVVIRTGQHQYLSALLPASTECYLAAFLNGPEPMTKRWVKRTCGDNRRNSLVIWRRKLLWVICSWMPVSHILMKWQKPVLEGFEPGSS